ncbi:NAD(P)-dependent alcohol dehydrogenase [Paraburkholderia sp. CNPSo 3076]|uniref:zinc-dependent alcohol dehydrogenase family protein n=1 Tax=Paraburkholderia sp. CNPSo 3076 TaxID=2940936 RepID=UPI0022533F7C|nr:NAD(P)-dependent alcohol dehydrogenase [Paraburkholderia sp. CNPSo 3076]MCX5541126.1 NAD(P)-dependent alcohol dehydrogenase [Paraburkholderia sp. CNPSo 3076]
MKAVRLVATGHQTSLRLHDESVPNPGRQEVLIRVYAASLNSRDQAVLNGPYDAVTKKNGIPLSDGAGEVVAIGEDVTRVKIGDRVAANCSVHWIGGSFVPDYASGSVGFALDGMLAEYALLHENAFVHLPAYMSYVEAACLPCAAVAAWSSLNLNTPLQPGQTVLTQGTGGVALFSLQIARMFGARVLAITSSDEKAEKLKALGAESVVNYTRFPDWERQILALTDGRGVDKVIDVVGGETIVKSAASTRIRGEIVMAGALGGLGGGLPVVDVLYRSLVIASATIGPRANFEALLQAMTMHQVRPVIDRIYPLAEYGEAYRRLESRKHVGKVVIDVVN